MNPKATLRPKHNMKRRALTATITCCLLSGPSTLLAATTAGTTEDEQAKLAMELNNPVAALISVPLQSNWDFGIGPNDAYQYTLKVQPVIPIKVNEDWNIISRTIVPIIDAESPAPGIKDVSGLGVSTQSFFVSPEKKTRHGLIWGAGPILMIPTATDDLLGSNQWGAGPTALVLKQQDGWTYGMLANQLWSFHGGNDATNATYLQPFISYTTQKHTSLALNTESTYDWRNDQWTVPVNLTVSQLVKIGKLPVQFQVGGRCMLKLQTMVPTGACASRSPFFFPNITTPFTFERIIPVIS